MAGYQGYKIGGTDIRVDLRVEGLDRTMQAFREIRRETGMRVREAVKVTADQYVLPEAKRGAGNLKVDGLSIAESLVVRKGRSNTVYITSTLRGKKGRAVGLLEYGGTVRTKIHPKRKVRMGHAAALAIGKNGMYRRAVKNPRHYKPRHHITDAVIRQHPVFASHVEDQLLEKFSQHPGIEVQR